MNDLTMPLPTLAQEALGAGPGTDGGSTQPASDPNAPGGGGGGGGANPFGGIFPILLALMVFMILSTFLSGRKDKKRRAEMLASIGKHDKVQTAGGIIGTVMEIKDDELVLRVDESSNTRIRFSRSAVQQVLHSSGRSQGAVEADKEAETVSA